MMTYKELEIEAMRVREAINELSVKGEHNAQLIVYAVSKCNDMISAMRELTNQNGGAKEVTKHGDE